MPKRIATQKTLDLQSKVKSKKKPERLPVSVKTKIYHSKGKKPKFGELTHDVPAIAEESKKVKETEVFAK